MAAHQQRDGSHQTKNQHIFRHPRLTAEDVAFHRRARRIDELEKEARKWIARSITFIARGRAANIELGRVFIRLKCIVGHGHFEQYFMRKFGRPYGIAFRTCQHYMRLSHKADEAKGANLAPFPLATDPHAVAVREATEKQRATLARTDRSSSEDATPDRETDGHERANEGSSICTCRLSIRMSEDQRARVSELWRSEHLALAASAVTDFLLELCAKYGIGGSASEEESDA